MYVNQFLRLFSNPLPFGYKPMLLEEPDFRKINLNKEKVKNYVDNMIQEDIRRSLDRMNAENVFNTIAENELYAEGYQVPIGSDGNYLRQFIKKHARTGALDVSKFRVQKNKANDDVFYVNNRIKKVLDNMTGEYTNAKKTTSVRQDGRTQNNGLERAVRTAMAKLEKEKQIWEQVRIPCIEGMQKVALYWSYWSFNPKLNYGSGDIEVKTYHPRDVLVDPNSKEKYFMDANYIIRRERMLLSDARKYFAQKPFNIDPKTIMPDNDYDLWDAGFREYLSEDSSMQQWVTIYKGELKRTYMDKIPLKEVYKSENLGEYGETELEEEKVYHFDFVYTRQTGCVMMSPNKYTNPRLTRAYQYKCIPYYNQQSAIKQYPISEVEKLRPIQDMANILDSAVLNNVKNRDKLRIMMAASLKATYGTLFLDWMRNGGIMPIDMSIMESDKVGDAFQEVKLEPVGQDLLAFAEKNEQAFRDQSIAHEALEGNYPEQGSLSGVAITKLQQANKKSISYKDINIQWAVTQEAILLYRMMAIEYSEDDWIQIEDAKQKDPSVVPINAGMTYAEYEEMLSEMYPGMDLLQATALFEKDNDVQYQDVMTEKDGGYLPMEDIMQNRSWVYINFLTEPESDKPYSLEIKVSLDFDVENDVILDAIKRSEEYKMGLLAKKDYLKAEYPDDWEERYQNLLEENQAAAIGEAVMKAPPEVQQQVQAVIQQAQLPQKKSA